MNIDKSKLIRLNPMGLIVGEFYLVEIRNPLASHIYYQLPALDEADRFAEWLSTIGYAGGLEALAKFRAQQSTLPALEFPSESKQERIERLKSELEKLK